MVDWFRFRARPPPEESSGSLVERLCRVDMCEVFSPPRVGTWAVKYGLSPGEAMGFTTGWEFNKAEDRDKSDAYLDAQKPLPVIGSPPCSPFSVSQNWNQDTLASRRTWDEWGEPHAIRH